MNQLANELTARVRLLRPPGLKWFATVLALLGLSALSISGLSSSLAPYEPPGIDQQRAMLRDWLQSADAAKAPAAERQRMMGWLARDFRAGYDWQEVVDESPADKRGRMVANARQLSRLIVADVVHGYSDTPERHRDDYVREQLMSFRDWQLLANRAAGESPAKGLDAVLRLAQEVYRDATPQERQQLDDLRRRAGKLALQMQIEQFLPGMR